MVKVKLFSPFEEITGKREINIKANNLGEFLQGLVKKYPKLKNAIFENFRERKLKENITILKEGVGIRELNTPLKDGDTVLIFSIIAGG